MTEKKQALNNADKPARNKDSVSNTLVMAILVSLVCSVLVTSTSLLLKPIQKQNQLKYSGTLKIAQLITTINPQLDADKLLSHLEIKMIDLETGNFTDAIDVTQYDQDEAIKDPNLSIVIPEDYDIAGLGQRSKFAMIYLLTEGSQYKYIILPVYGSGMWSTLYGYLLLEADANTIAGLKFYQHGETPGIGDKIDNPAWLKQWQGKRIYKNEIPVIQITKNKTSDEAIYQIDAISGATMTTRGINNLLQYWLGEHGYQPFLKRVSMPEEK